MPGTFATGLTEGLLNGFSQAQEKKNQLETQQKSQELERWTRMATSPDMPDEDRQYALQQIQSIMQGKKAGAKSGGPLSPVLQQLHKLIGASHKPQGQQPPPQGGWTENLPNGQAAPGTGGSQPGNLPSLPNGRAPLAGSGPAAGDPSAQPAPQAQPQQPQVPPNPLDAQIAQAQKALEAAKSTGNGFTVKRAQDQIDALQAEKAKGDAADYYDARKQDRLEGGRETMATMQAQFKSEMAAAQAQGKEELARVQGEWKQKFEKQAEDAKTVLQKQIDDDRKERETLVAQIKAKASPAKVGTGTIGQTIEKKAAASPGLDADAWEYGLTGKTPATGYGKDAAQFKIDVVQRWRQIMASTGLEPSDIVALRAASAADKSALAKMTNLDASVNQFEGTLERNLKLSEQLNKEFDRTDFKFANRVEAYLRGQRSDPAVTNFMAQLYTMAPEYAKIMAGSTSAAGATVSGTEEAKSMFNAYISKNGIQSLFDNVIRPDMANRKAAIEQEKAQKLSDLKGKNAVQNVGGGGGRGGAQGATIHFKEGQDSYDIPAAEVDGFKKLHPQAQAVQ